MATGQGRDTVAEAALEPCHVELVSLLRAAYELQSPGEPLILQLVRHRDGERERERERESEGTSVNAVIMLVPTSA